MSERYYPKYISNPKLADYKPIQPLLYHRKQSDNKRLSISWKPWFVTENFLTEVNLNNILIH